MSAFTSTFIGCFLIAAVGGTPDSSPFPSVTEAAWIASQSIFLTIPGVAICFALPAGRLRLVRLAAIASILVMPVLMLLDGFVFHWVGEQILSLSMRRVFGELLVGLASFLSAGIILALGILLAGCVLAVTAIHFSASRLARSGWFAGRSPSPFLTVVILSSIACLFALPTVAGWDTARNRMRKHPSQHPFCVLGFFSAEPVEHASLDPPSAVETATLANAIQIRDDRLRRLSVDSVADAAQLPDVVFVVVESFRRELVTPEVMPELSKLADRSLHCKRHFSGGNATNHGIFSLVNGLEAVWYERPVRYSPILNRLFRTAGYEIGLFAGADDWRTFHMDGFISAEQFDVFEVGPRRGLASDRRATMQASHFLNRRDLSDNDQRRPRLAILYLYATHAIYQSYAEDQVFSPAADDRFIYPYPVSMQERVWNRYKNSARTVDRFLAAVMKDERVVIVTGDHGEAFLEDSTIGHGVRLSEYQNMTPAVVYVPGREPRVIDAPTMHADLLPTLLSAVGIQVSDPKAIDGMNLLKASDSQIADRVFVSRDYLRDEVAIIGPWTESVEQRASHEQTNSDESGRSNARPFAYRARVSLADAAEAELVPRDAIDARGFRVVLTNQEGPASALRRWSLARFPIDSAGGVSAD